MVTEDELRKLCDYLNDRIVPGTEPGNHCDGTGKYAEDYLASIGELDERLADYQEAGHAVCDCFYLMQACSDQQPMQCADCDAILTSCGHHSKAVH